MKQSDCDLILKTANNLQDGFKACRVSISVLSGDSLSEKIENLMKELVNYVQQALISYGNGYKDECVAFLERAFDSNMAITVNVRLLCELGHINESQYIGLVKWCNDINQLIVDVKHSLSPVKRKNWFAKLFSSEA